MRPSVFTASAPQHPGDFMRAFRCSAVALATAFVWLTAALAHADDFSDFRIPTHSVVFATGSLGSSGGRSVLSSPNVQTHSGDVSGSGGGLFSWVRESDASSMYGSWNGTVSGTRAHSKSEPDFFADRLESRGVLAEERTNLALGYQRYMGGPDFSLGAGASANGNYLQRWNSIASVSESSGLTHRNERDQQLWQYLPVYRLAISAGVGRLRDVTGIYQMLLIEKRLREAGVLTRDLSPQARQQLANLVYLRDRFGTVHERPARGMWAEIERILRDDRALAGDALTPDAAFRAVEPLLGGTSGISRDGLSSDLYRQRGASLAVSLAGSEARQVARYDSHLLDRYTDVFTDTILESRSSSRIDDVFDQYTLGVTGRYARPVGLRQLWQGAVNLSRELHRVQQSTDLNAQVSSTRVLVDRWVADGAIQWSRSWAGDRAPSAPNDGWSWDLGVSLSYYMEDHLALTLTAQDSQWRADDSFSRGDSYSLGLSYRFAGRLIAPGFAGLGHTGPGMASL